MRRLWHDVGHMERWRTDMESIYATICVWTKCMQIYQCARTHAVHHYCQAGRQAHGSAGRECFTRPLRSSSFQAALHDAVQSSYIPRPITKEKHHHLAAGGTSSFLQCRFWLNCTGAVTPGPARQESALPARQLSMRGGGPRTTFVHAVRAQYSAYSTCVYLVSAFPIQSLLYA